MLVIFNLLSCVFRPKPPSFGSLTLCRPRSKQTCWRGRSCQAKPTSSIQLLTIKLSSHGLHLSIRLLQRTPWVPHSHHDRSESASVGRQSSECNVQLMASSNITIAAYWLPEFSRCRTRGYCGLCRFRLHHDLVEPANDWPRLLQMMFIFEDSSAAVWETLVYTVL